MRLFKTTLEDRGQVKAQSDLQPPQQVNKKQRDKGVISARTHTPMHTHRLLEPVFNWFQPSPSKNQFDVPSGNSQTELSDPHHYVKVKCDLVTEYVLEYNGSSFKNEGS